MTSPVIYLTDARKRLLQQHKPEIWKTDGLKLLNAVFTPEQTVLTTPTTSKQTVLTTPGTSKQTVLTTPATSKQTESYVDGFLMTLRVHFAEHCLQHDNLFTSNTEPSFAELYNYVVDSCIHVFVSICLALVEDRLERRVSINNYEKAADLSFMVFLIMVFEHGMPVNASYISIMHKLYVEMTSDDMTSAYTMHTQDVARSIACKIVQYLPSA